MNYRSRAAAALRIVMPVGLRRRVRQMMIGLPFGLSFLKRVSPVSPSLGLSGRPLDRYYIESFLEGYAELVRGRVLEVGDATYTHQFGGLRVTQSDVLHVTSGAPNATIIADLASGEGLAPATFDCIIVTQTLQMIFDCSAAVRTLYRLLAPGGTLLVTLPGIAPISRYDMERWGDYWRFSSLAARRLFESVAPPETVTIHPYGNLRSAVAFLAGLSPDDVGKSQLDARDLDYEVIIGVQVSKPISQISGSPEEHL